jgi:hypothetical protein
MTSNSRGQQLNVELRHFCRGCGSMLPVNFRGLYHNECLRADKRRRIQGKRQREQERFKRRLEEQRCPHCGLKYCDPRSGRNVQPPCEASQAIQEKRSADE